MTCSFIPYGKQWLDEADIAAVIQVLKSDFLTQGPAVAAFEKSIAEYVGAKYCVAFCNATAALHCAVKVLNIPERLEGITSTNTFVASANCLAYNRLVPILADIDAHTYNVTAETLAARITDCSRVLIPVHFAGQPCDMPAIANLAKEKKLFVIEDASHAIGSRYADGSMVGNCQYSDMTIFSFHPVKTLTTGEGGVVATNDPEIHRALTMVRSHGITKDPSLLSDNPGPWYYEQHQLGYNYRITDIQCALGLRQLTKVEFFKKRRSEIIKVYNQAFSGINALTTPQVGPAESCFHLYVLQIDFAQIGKSRATFMHDMAQKGVGSQVHYIPVHTQPWYRKSYGYDWGMCPVAERFYQRALSIPLYPSMDADDMGRVIDAVKTSL
jgi:UDP-4-amino-4,6-dideoxy-N-acetyl-beta-L-altrosamine transaminase